MRAIASDKYRPYAFPYIPADFSERTWPSKTITKPPVWCSVDLRDGNQALVEPMGTDRKVRFWNALLKMGFKEIEVGFPSASDTDFEFVRHIIDNKLIPEDVSIQVLTQCRPELITRTFEAIKGAPSAIVHFYNSTSTAQRRVVFGMDENGITEIATSAAKLVRELHEAGAAGDTAVRYQYSPESFTGTELAYTVEICEAVMDVLEPTPERKLILNLPATVEMCTPNTYADQIEWFSRNIKHRDSIILSVHPHNDRGTAVAATELALMAGAERVEGTLFGNGERTGNVDIVTLSLNMFTQGVDPGVVIDDINELMRTVEYCNQLPVHPRHPYAGELVFTAFSGSHQDAINKGMREVREKNDPLWDVPYLPMDPADVGRTYEAIIRINSQSGKGGISYILETDYGISLPRRAQIEFSKVIQQLTDREGHEVPSDKIWDVFNAEYLDQNGPLSFLGYQTLPGESGGRELTAKLRVYGEELEIKGKGSGPISAFVDGLANALGFELDVIDYREHAVGSGKDTNAYAYVEMRAPNETTLFGVGKHDNIVEASLRAVVSAANRAQRMGLFRLGG
ncbi:MAG TPA: 2-isopropylmalate synthase [Alphaproteobacteria bacterium]|nr:2-isopropylmalate synthase [Alphaproteobacteria bacterium]